MQSKTLFSAAAGFTACLLSLALVATPTLAKDANKGERGVESGHQPDVSRTDFVFDVAGGSDGALETSEARRLKAWFDALGLRYGDHVTVAGMGASGLAGVRNSIAELVARYGLLTEGEAPVTAGDPPAGSLRVVVSRSTATVPGCPDWANHAEADLTGAQGSNYGCAMAKNLAAMLADPQDLVRGRTSETDLRIVTSNRAIQTYQQKTPTGAGGLDSVSTKGN